MDLAEIRDYLKVGDQTDIARKLGVDRKTVYRAINGLSKSPRVLYAAEIVAKRNKEEVEKAVS